jgi:hypothetical protein
VSRIWKQLPAFVRNGSAGTSWIPLDAAGDWHGSSCPGSTGAYFFNPVAGWSGRELCVSRNLGSPRGGPHERIHTVWGWPRIARSRAREPNANTNDCGPLFGPCFDYGGSTSITVTPWRQFLTLTATPAQTAEGDSVTFTASAAPHSVTVREWIWVPDQPLMALRGATDSATTVDIRSASATSVAGCSGQSVCRVRAFQTGTMYVRARVNAPGQRRVEQASARVTVRRLQLSVACIPTPVVRGTPVECTAQWDGESGQIASMTFLPDTGRQLPTVSRTISFPGRIEWWRGIAVHSGNVVARGTVGSRLDSASTRLSVSNRDWSTKTVPDSSLLDTLTFSDPPASPQQLGQIEPFIVDLPARIRQVDQGPNNGYWFALDIPIRTEFVTRVNRRALRAGSVFWLRHVAPTAANPSGRPWCTTSYVETAYERARRHEGTSRADANSHYSAALQHLDPRVRAAVEPWVSSSQFISLPFLLWLGEAMGYSNEIAHNEALDPFGPRFCDFVFP